MTRYFMKMSDGATCKETDVVVVCRLMDMKQGTTVLSIYVDGPISQKEISRFLGSLATNSTITTLNMRGTGMGVEGGKAIGKALATNSTLTTLHLGGNRIGEEGGKVIAEALATNSTLTKLNMSGNGIGEQGGKVIGEALAKNSAITMLNLGGNRIGEEGGKVIAEALATNSTLTKLNMSGNGIGEQGGKVIGEALAKNSAITMLKLYSNEIGDEGGKAIGEGLAKNSTLTTLDLSRNKIGDEGGMAICNALTENSILTTLDIDDNMITSLPVSLGVAPSLTELSVHGNPLVFPRKDIVLRGLHLDFLRQCAQGTSTVKPRLVLIGNGGAGKTTIKFALTTQRDDVLRQVRAAMEAWRLEHWKEWVKEVCSSKGVTLEGYFAPNVPVDLACQGSVSSLLNTIAHEGVRDQVAGDIAAVKDATTDSLWSWLAGSIRNVVGPERDESDSDVYAYLTRIPHVATRSVDVVEWNHLGDGAAEIWDFAGQHQYFPANSVLLGSSATVFLLVIDGSHGVADQMWFWLSFVSSMQDPHSPLRPQVVLMISKSDKNPSAGSMARRLLGDVQRRFPSLNIVQRENEFPFCVNYSDRSSIDDIRLAVSKCLRNVQEGRFLEYNAFPRSFEEVFNELLSKKGSKSITLKREVFDDVVDSKLGDDSGLFTCFFTGRGDLHVLRSFAVMRPVVASSFIMYRLCDPTSVLVQHAGRLSHDDMLVSVRLALERHGFDTKADVTDEQSTLQLMQDYGLCLRLNDEWVMPSLLAPSDGTPLPRLQRPCTSRCITVRHSATDRAVLPPGLFNKIVSKVFEWLDSRSEYVKKICMDLLVFSSPMFAGPCVIELDSHSVYVLACGGNHHRLLVEIMEVVMAVTAGYPGANWRLQHLCPTCAHEAVSSLDVEQPTLSTVPRHDLKLTLEAPPKRLNDAADLPGVSPLQCNPWLASHELSDRSVKLCSEQHELSVSIPLSAVPSPPAVPGPSLLCFRSVVRVFGGDKQVLGVMRDSNLVVCPADLNPEYIIVGSGDPGIRVDVAGEVRCEASFVSFSLSSEVPDHAPSAPDDEVVVWWDPQNGVKLWSIDHVDPPAQYVRFSQSGVSFHPGGAVIPYLADVIESQSPRTSSSERLERKVDEIIGTVAVIKESLDEVNVRLNVEWGNTLARLIRDVDAVRAMTEQREAGNLLAPFFRIRAIQTSMDGKAGPNAGLFCRLKDAATHRANRVAALLRMSKSVQITVLCEDPSHGAFVDATTSNGGVLVVSMPKEWPTKVVRALNAAKSVVKHVTPFWNAACVICWMFAIPLPPLPKLTDALDSTKDAIQRNLALLEGNIGKATQLHFEGKGEVPLDDFLATCEYVDETFTEVACEGEELEFEPKYELKDVPELRRQTNTMRQLDEAWCAVVIAVLEQGGPDLSKELHCPVRLTKMEHGFGYACLACIEKRGRVTTMKGTKKKVKKKRNAQQPGKKKVEGGSGGESHRRTGERSTGKARRVRSDP